ncbi:hypothetical protein ACV1DR_22980 [Aeromonas jandaei]
MNHYQADRHNALDAISQAQRIAFAPMLFQAASPGVRIVVA